ncbi:hypothetical protein [Paraburkholderia sp. BL25I1N1]|uniref:hypothetical protein n=1 Tax=Paraburkholderia sp. BL25I1N1 TaxID=1938804 RepID=UPI000D0692BB|nr:hypothetical protein [Paraburkholderia sp. BL25I1N1]PRY03797.1 hypothetical protein B0G73_114118 [Paraburkholderia sp. BL25I1N1]
MIAQFADDTNAVVIGIFSSPQPLDAVEFQGLIDATDPRYKAWWNRLLTGTITLGLPTPE